MNILIDNQDLNTIYGVQVLDYTKAFGFPKERENEREWYNKSGKDKNLTNARYEAKDFVIKCCVKASNEVAAFNQINTLVEYMLTKKVVVLSFRDATNGIRECFLVERSKIINPTINVRQQNSLYVFNLGLRDVNPNALKFKTEVIVNSAEIAYTKGRTASVFWGNGDNGIVSNSKTYTKSDYTADGLVDIIVDIDKDQSDLVSLAAAFTEDKTSLIKPESVQFTDQSTGNISVWSWVVTKGGVIKYTSALQNPLIEFDEDGTFSVTLQVFNEAAGSDSTIKTDYITVRNSRMIADDAGGFALADDVGSYGAIN